MKFLLVAIIGVLLYNSNDARFFISDQLNNAAEVIRPDAQLNIRLRWKQRQQLIKSKLQHQRDIYLS